MRLYPQRPHLLAGTIVRDLLVVVLLVCCWLAGSLVHDTVSGLSVLGRGVQEAGSGVHDGFRRAGDAVDGAPLVGDDLERALQDAGGATGGRAVRAGREGERRVERLADVLALAVGGLPAAVLLALYLPRRGRQVRALTAAERMLRASVEDDPERARLVAMRAAFGLPYETLLRHTRDPLGDLAAGRFDPLHAAVLEDAGLRPRRLQAARDR